MTTDDVTCWTCGRSTGRASALLCKRCHGADDVIRPYMQAAWDDGDQFAVLCALDSLRRRLEVALQTQVRTAREDYGMSWSEIGDALGMTKQAAQQRWSV